MTPRKISVLLADDHLIVREGLRSTLSEFQTIRIAGEAGDGLEAIEKVRKLKPNVVLMDINMPRMNGLDATRNIRENFPKTRVLVVTVHDSPQYISQVLRAGAQGYVLKDTSPDELARAIESVHNGGAVLSPSVAQHVVDRYVKDGDSGKESSPISPRDRQILKLAATGHTSKEIAQELNLSVRSVETYRLRLMRRLKVRNAAELTKFALQSQLVS